MNHLDVCTDGTDQTCPDCTEAGIITTDECPTCGSCRWIHRHDDRVWNPVTGRVVR